MSNALLRVSGFQVTIAGAGPRRVVADVQFHIDRDETVILLGESGSGKTLLSRAITGLVGNRQGISVSGEVHFEGQPLLTLDEEKMRAIRRRKIRYVFQDPMQALNPLATVRTQMTLASPVSVNDVTLVQHLAAVRIPRGEEVLPLYPHQLSVGMAQRILVAMAVMPSPALLIADEPTSALDASLRFQVLDLIQSVRTLHHMSVLLITHDLTIALKYGHRILILHDGRIVESATTEEFRRSPQHEYSKLLLARHMAVISARTLA